MSEQVIEPADARLFLVGDSPNEVVDSISDVKMKRFGPTYGPRARPRWYLGETG